MELSKAGAAVAGNVAQGSRKLVVSGPNWLGKASSAEGSQYKFRKQRIEPTNLPNTEEKTCASEEPYTSDETDQSQTGGRPQESLEEMGGTGGGGRRETETIEAVLSDNDSKQNIGADPERTQVSTESLVRIFQGLFVGLNRRNVRRQSALNSRLELRVDVGLR